MSLPTYFTRLICVCSLLFITPACLAKDATNVIVDTGYIDVHTGPGRGYPVFHALEKGETIELLKQRTDWIKVKTKRGKKGWIHVSDVNKTRGVNGEVVAFSTPGFEQFSNRKFELGFSAGQFENSDSISAYVGWHLNKNIALEAHATQVVGDFSDSSMFTANVVLTPFTNWRITPFVTLGAGTIDISPDATLVSTEDRTNDVLQVGGGIYGYIGRRFVARLQYNNNTLVTDRNENEEINEWRLGITAFF
ncbi:SH3 domain-containing protein [Sessilibacter sp. MAH2]